ncbi:uncharacterized protein LOC130136797 [Syzygium oleosum]|uniref:uncharacterized protein LOC130136797 n=1 Tax=Syzygium oleosum TaxID=219896 RepID=UPI0024B8C718|nr:uncharacterized protein LOC130136797 [Syzygium oleosum]
MQNVINKAKRKQEKPDFITADNWTEIMRTWDTEKHKQISEINKKNRASSSSEGSATYAGALSTSGSVEKEWQMNWGRNQHLWLHLNAPFRKKIRHGLAIEQKLLRTNMMNL